MMNSFVASLADPHDLKWFGVVFVMALRCAKDITLRASRRSYQQAITDGADNSSSSRVFPRVSIPVVLAVLTELLRVVFPPGFVGLSDLLPVSSIVGLCVSLPRFWIFSWHQ
jgi:C4-dicarboxylate transporter